MLAPFRAELVCNSYFAITNGTCNNLILDSIEAVLSPFLSLFGMTGVVFFVLLIESFFVSLVSSLCFFSMYIHCMSFRFLQISQSSA